MRTRPPLQAAEINAADAAARKVTAALALYSGGALARLSEAQMLPLYDLLENVFVAGALESGLELAMQAQRARPEDESLQFMVAQALDTSGRLSAAVASYERRLVHVLPEAVEIAQRNAARAGTRNHDALMEDVEIVRLVRYILQKLLVIYASLRRPDDLRETFALVKSLAPGLVLWQSPWQLPSQKYDPQRLAQPWHDPRDFPDALALKANFKVIRGELDAFLRAGHRFDGLQGDHTLQRRDGDWREFMLWQHGVYNQTSCASFPRTCKLVSTLPSVS
jgi:hypothetical protein